MATDAPGAAAIRLAGVSKRFGSLAVLRGLDLTVRRGELFALMGLSGTGKSVTLKHLIGLLTPDAGTITVDGRDLSSLDAAGWSAYLRRCGVVFQAAALFDSMSVGENVAFPLREHTGLQEDEIHARAAALLERVQLPGLYDRSTGELSGGMRQRVALARGLALRPDFVFFDEPTSGLDRVTSAVIEDLMMETHEAFGYTGVVITHHWELAERAADRVALLWEGRIRFWGTPAEFAAADDPIVRGFLSRDPRAFGLRP